MPDIGVATDRRTFRHVQEHAGDDRIHSLVCFVCAQIRTTCSGYPRIDLSKPPDAEGAQNREIDAWGPGALRRLEENAPGTLLNNCSYDLWRARYVHQKNSNTRVNPLSAIEPQGSFFHSHCCLIVFVILGGVRPTKRNTSADIGRRAFFSLRLQT